MKARFTLVLILSFSLNVIHSQSLSPTVISSAGGYASNANFSLSWTLGEIAVTTLTGGNYILTQGFQQPVIIGTGIGDAGLTWGVQAYPNPVDHSLRIRFSIENSMDFTIEVMDLTGKTIRSESYPSVGNNQEIELDMSRMVQGIYLLKIRSVDRKVSKTVRIQKY